MRSILSLIDRATERVVGHVDAGACVTDHGCCCKTGHPHYGVGCYGSCKYMGADFQCRTGSQCTFY
ncbi:MAG: hypothetical protein ABJA34_11225 [Pseudonocardiales bacterium]